MQTDIKYAGTIASKYKLKYYDILVAAFVGILLISNIGSTKIIGIGPVTFDGGTILFPVIYILGSIITEVYGFKLARRAIWLGFMTMVLATLTLSVIQLLPAASSSTTHEAFNQIAGFIPRIAAASLVAYLIGQYINTTLTSKLKVKMKGRSYWLRSFVSSSLGQAIDTVIFAVVAFAGVISGQELMLLIATVYLLKVGFELLILPFSTRLVAAMKRREALDVYDKKMHYSLIGDLSTRD